MSTQALTAGRSPTRTRRPSGLQVVGGLYLVIAAPAVSRLLLAVGRAAFWGWADVIGFHLPLLFGWWAWFWAVPALVVRVALAGRDPEVGAGVPFLAPRELR